METELCSLAIPSILICAIVSAYFLHKRERRNDKKLPPGPRGLQASLDMLKAMLDGTLYQKAQAWYRQYGELVFCPSLFGDVCFLNSARMIREVFAGKGSEVSCSGRPASFFGQYAMNNYTNLGTGSLYVNPDWNKLRKLFHQTLKVYGNGEQGFERTVKTELCRLVSEIESRVGEEIDTEDLFSTSILIALHTLLNGQHAERDWLIIQAMREMDDTVNEMLNPYTDRVLSRFPFLHLVPGTFYWKLVTKQKACKETIIQELFVKTKQSHIPNQPRGIIDHFLDEQAKDDNHWLTDDNIIGMMFDVIIGGFLNTTQTIRSALFFLVHNPEVIRKVQKEIEENVGERLPELGDRRELPYMEAFFMETLRHTATIGFPHLTYDDVIIGEYTVPKGCRVQSNPWAFHHDPEIWGDPDNFRPERFLDDVTGNLLAPSHSTRQNWASFGAGKRSCPGEMLARSRIFLYVTMLLQRFDILPPVQNKLLPLSLESWEDKIVFGLKPYWLIFRKRM